MKCADGSSRKGESRLQSGAESAIHLKELAKHAVAATTGSARIPSMRALRPRSTAPCDAYYAPPLCPHQASPPISRDRRRSGVYNYEGVVGRVRCPAT